jgi:hypothetical protein
MLFWVYFTTNLNTLIYIDCTKCSPASWLSQYHPPVEDITSFLLFIGARRKCSLCVVISLCFKSFRRIMAIPRRRPFTNLWYKVYREIVRKGHYLSGLPFSITNDTCLLSIPPGSDRRFKLYMAWFTLYNLINVLNYIYILLWGSEDDFKNQAIHVCYTFVCLCIWGLTLLICVKSHQMSSTINSIIEYVGIFNGMS